MPCSVAKKIKTGKDTVHLSETLIRWDVFFFLKINIYKKSSSKRLFYGV